MPRWDDRPALIWPHALVAALAGRGFALTLFVFYPGVMTYNARCMYKAIATGQVGDGKSP